MQARVDIAAREQEAVAEAVDVASDKTMDYGSIALSKADEATNVAARATANKVAEVGSSPHQVQDVETNLTCGGRRLPVAHPVHQQSGHGS